jgi:hypothetical protein
MMTQIDALTRHLSLCDDLYRLAIEENHFLKTRGCIPGADLTARKKDLLIRLEESIAALRLPAAPLSPEERRVADQAKAKILQFLHLDRENEQRFLRCSLTGPRRPAEMPGAAQLQRAYAVRG